MVEVLVVGIPGRELAGVQEHPHQQAVQFRGSIEVVALSCLRSIRRVGCSQFRNPSQDSVRTACAKSGVKREMGHQVTRHILNAMASSEVEACQRIDNLAVLIPE